MRTLTNTRNMVGSKVVATITCTVVSVNARIVAMLFTGGIQA